MRKAIMITGLVLALGVLAPATALGNAGGTDRPVQGSGSGTTVLDLPISDFITDATRCSVDSWCCSSYTAIGLMSRH